MTGADSSGRAGPEGPPAAVLARFAAQRVASLATLSAAGPRLVPVTFAWHDGAAVWAVDRVKPKRPGPLRRERDLAADPRVALLVDHYEETGRRCGGSSSRARRPPSRGRPPRPPWTPWPAAIPPTGTTVRRARWWP